MVVLVVLASVVLESVVLVESVVVLLVPVELPLLLVDVELELLLGKTRGSTGPRPLLISTVILAKMDRARDAWSTRSRPAWVWKNCTFRATYSEPRSTTLMARARMTSRRVKAPRPSACRRMITELRWRWWKSWLRWNWCWNWCWNYPPSRWRSNPACCRAWTHRTPSGPDRSRAWNRWHGRVSRESARGVSRPHPPRDSPFSIANPGCSRRRPSRRSAWAGNRQRPRPAWTGRACCPGCAG